MSEEILDFLVAGSWVMVKDGKRFHFSAGGQFDSHDVARMPPMFSYPHRLGVSVGGVENQQVGIAYEINEWIILAVGLVLVLGVGRIYHRGILPVDPVTERYSWVILFDESYFAVAGLDDVTGSMNFEGSLALKVSKSMGKYGSFI